MRCLFCVEKTVCYFLFIFLLCFVFLKSIQKQKPRIALQNNVGITWNLWSQLSVVMMVPWQSLIGILMGFTYICTTPSYNDNPFELQRGGGRRTLTCWWSQYGCVSMSRTNKSAILFFFFYLTWLITDSSPPTPQVCQTTLWSTVKSKYRKASTYSITIALHQFCLKQNLISLLTHAVQLYSYSKSYTSMEHCDIRCKN